MDNSYQRINFKLCNNTKITQRELWENKSLRGQDKKHQKISIRSRCNFGNLMVDSFYTRDVAIFSRTIFISSHLLHISPDKRSYWEPFNKQLNYKRYYQISLFVAFRKNLNYNRARNEYEFKKTKRISSIRWGDHFYHWEELDSFWFSKKEGQNIFNVLTKFRFPGLLMLVMGDAPEEELKTVTARYLPFHEIAPKSTLEKWSESLQKNFPLETPHKQSSFFFKTIIE